VASNWVRCVSSDSINDSPDRPFPYFSFHNHVTEALNAAQVNDIVWIATPSHAINLNIDRPISIVGKISDSNQSPALTSENENASVLTATDFDNEYGLRLIGCTIQDSTNASGGAGLKFSGIKNLYISHCRFERNFAGQSFSNREGNGGAIFIEDCHRILIESCYFHTNSGKRGGAIYAEDCRNLVITGTKNSYLDDLLVSIAEINDFILPEPLPNKVAEIPSALTGLGFSTLFIENYADKAGGALCFVNCTFRIRHAYFAKHKTTNKAGYGGAVAVQIFDSKLVNFENEVLGCLFIENTATAGGGVAVAAEHDGSGALGGQPQTLLGFGEGQCLLIQNVFHANKATKGGGIGLWRGIFQLEANRISKNTANENGGGVSCIARCHADFVNNSVLRNKVTRKEPEASPGGGGGIYATFFTGEDYTSIALSGNKIIGNHSTEDGGGLRATCGSRVDLKFNNIFKDNTAFHNGGAVSIRNAHLSILPGNIFENNHTKDGGNGHHRGGDGGALHCSGDYPTKDNVTRVGVFGACVSDGAGLSISGSDADPIRFVQNQAVRQGGAIYVSQEVDFVASRLIGLLKKVQIQHVEFDRNLSLGHLTSEENPLIGSTITIRGLTLWQTITNHRFGDFYVLNNLRISLSQGVGLHLIDSQDIDRNENINIIILPSTNKVQEELVFNSH
jgi:predicted outer membrane repeat protein